MSSARKNKQAHTNTPNEGPAQRDQPILAKGSEVRSHKEQVIRPDTKGQLEQQTPQTEPNCPPPALRPPLQGAGVPHNQLKRQRESNEYGDEVAVVMSSSYPPRPLPAQHPGYMYPAAFVTPNVAQNPQSVRGSVYHGYPYVQPSHNMNLQYLPPSGYMPYVVSQAPYNPENVGQSGNQRPWPQMPGWVQGTNTYQPTSYQQTVPQMVQEQNASALVENVEKQIDKLTSRRPKRARRANYQLASALPIASSSVDSKDHLVLPKTGDDSRVNKNKKVKKLLNTKDSSSGPSSAKTNDGESAEGSQDSTAKKRTRNPETTSCYRGVSWNKANKSWKACIKVKGKNIHIGYFGDDVDAAKAYDMVAQQYRGANAKVNFPQSRIEFSNAISRGSS